MSCCPCVFVRILAWHFFFIESDIMTFINLLLLVIQPQTICFVGWIIGHEHSLHTFGIYNFFQSSFKTWTYASQPKTFIWITNGFSFVHILNDVLPFSVHVSMWFNVYIIVCVASTQNLKCNPLSYIKFQTNSTVVWISLLATQFCFEVDVMVRFCINNYKIHPKPKFTLNSSTLFNILSSFFLMNPTYLSKQDNASNFLVILHKTLYDEWSFVKWCSN